MLIVLRGQLSFIISPIQYEGFNNLACLHSALFNCIANASTQSDPPMSAIRVPSLISDEIWAVEVEKINSVSVRLRFDSSTSRSYFRNLTF